MVLTLRFNSLAIAPTGLPEAIMSITWYSRSERISWGSFSGSLSNSPARIWASEPLMYFSPLSTLRIARTSSSPALSFVRYPDAPARMARIANCSSGCMLRIRTGSFGRCCLISFNASNPPFPGILMSSTTRSYPPFQTLRTASCPFPASSTWTGWRVSARTFVNPFRTTSWSSATSILSIRGRPFPDGKSHSYQGSLAGFSSDYGFPSENPDAFPDPDEAERMRVENPSFHDPDSVVSHLQDQGIALLRQPHLHLRRRGMAHDICQGLLNDAEDRRGADGVGDLAHRLYRNVAADPCPVLEILRHPFDCGGHAEFIQDPGPELGRNLSHRPDDAEHRSFDFADFRGLPVKSFGVQTFSEQQEVQFQGRQRLPQLVVDFARDARPFFLQQGLQTSREVAQPFAGFRESLLCPLPIVEHPLH